MAKSEGKLDKRIIKIAKKVVELRVTNTTLSNEGFAMEHGLSRTYYWKFEKGKNFTIEYLLKILDIHKVTLEEFFKGL